MWPQFPIDTSRNLLARLATCPNLWFPHSLARLVTGNHDYEPRGSTANTAQESTGTVREIYANGQIIATRLGCSSLRSGASIQKDARLRRSRPTVPALTNARRLTTGLKRSLGHVQPSCGIDG